MDTMPSPLKGLKVCYFGHFSSEYSRNRVLIKALRRAGAEVVQVQSRSRAWNRWQRLALHGLQTEFDLMIVGFPGHTDVPLGRLICSIKRRPLIFDAFVSLYDSAVFDRAVVQPDTLRARQLFWVDKLACMLSDRVFLDTNAHIEYFVRTFRLSREKFRRIWVGTDEEIMQPHDHPSIEEPFCVFFYGSYIPLHGADCIVRSAHLVESRDKTVHFLMVGSGQTFPQVRALAETLRVKSITFKGRVAYERLPQMIARAHVCLGIFGTTPKAYRVIPNKVFDALAVGRPLITADTPAVREALRHGESVWLVPAGDEKALAEAILTLKNDKLLRRRLAANGHRVFKEQFSLNAISSCLVQAIEELLQCR